MMRIPSACSLSLSAGSAEDHQGREQALNLIVTSLKLLTCSTSPPRARTLFYLKGLVRIKVSLKQSHTRGKEFGGSPHR